MPEIVISEFMDDAAVNRLKASHSTHYDPNLVDQPEELAKLLPEARAFIVRNRTRVTAGLLDAAPQLQCVGRLGVGLDNIDLDACETRGVSVYPATGANDLSVAEYVVTASLILLRTAWLSSDRVAEGAWPRQQLMGREVSGRIMGLVGYGAIARQVAERVRALGMNVIAHDPFIPHSSDLWGDTRCCSLDEVLASADVVSLHVPLTEQTHHLINAAAMSKMKPDSLLINTARGGVVDEAALAEALGQGRLGGAALDVFEQEPLSAESGARFKGLANIVLTPHIAGVTAESNIRVSELIADRIADHLRAHA